MSAMNALMNNNTNSYTHTNPTTANAISIPLTLRLPSFFATSATKGVFLPPPFDFVFGFRYHIMQYSS